MTEQTKAEAGAKLADSDVLWALHIIGPDEVYPAPSRELAEQAVEVFNTWYARQPKGDGYPEMSAAVIEWPYGARSHAVEAPYFVENFITPRGELAESHARALIGASEKEQQS